MAGLALPRSLPLAHARCKAATKGVCNLAWAATQQWSTARVQLPPPLRGSDRRHYCDANAGEHMYANLYGILGVERSVTAAKLRQRYTAIVKQLHPDTATAAPVTGDSLRLEAAVEAYNVLRDPQRRALYDASLQVAQSNKLAQAIEDAIAADAMQLRGMRRRSALVALLQSPHAQLALHADPNGVPQPLWNSAFSSLASFARVKDVEELWVVATSIGVPLDDGCHNTRLSLLLRHKNIDCAAALATKMKREQRQLSLQNTNALRSFAAYREVLGISVENNGAELGEQAPTASMSRKERREMLANLFKK